MGKKTKKIKKNIAAINCEKNQKDTNIVQMQKINELKDKITDYKEQGKYEDALTLVIKLFEIGYTNLEIVYETAEIYYLIGDNERAIIWAKKALSFDFKYINAQVLLAKIYVMQDEMNNCFDIIETLINSHNEISAEVCSEIEDLLIYFQDDYDEKALQNQYPLLYEFWRSTEENLNQEELSEAENNLVVNETEIYDEKVHLSKEEKGAENIKIEQDEFACLEGKNIDEVIDAIMQQSVSLIEKIDLCLHFAIYYYMQNDLVKTLLLLKQGLLIDSKNELVLKNAGFVLAEMGEKAGALEILLQIKGKDLMVLKQIELLSNKI